MAYTNAATLYQGTKVNTASPAELTLMLYEGAIKFCNIGLLGFENKDYEVQLKMPAYICAGQYVKLELIIEKTGEEPASLYYEGVVQTPALSTLGGEQELPLLRRSPCITINTKGFAVTLVSDYCLPS